jgi:hypothetical protein
MPLINSRERVITALTHAESDRAPIDLGGCVPTAIHAKTNAGLLQCLGIEEEIRLWGVVGRTASYRTTGSKVD